MQVLKFGGTSVADAANIERVIKIVKEALQRDRTIVVCSAISKCTDSLIEAGSLAAQSKKEYLQKIEDISKRHHLLVDELISSNKREQGHAIVNEITQELRRVCDGIAALGEMTKRSLDLVMSFGEILSTKIISLKFTDEGINNRWADSREIIRTQNGNTPITVDNSYLETATSKLISSNGTRLIILPGFIASDKNGITTTLGRGGSDFTASLIAAASNARILEIWTDVNGMMTADPRVVKEAKTIGNISYKEALELSHFGAKVVYPPTIQPVVSKGIPILVKNTFDPHGESTRIESRPPDSSNKIRGISVSNRIALLSMEGSGMVGIPGYSSRLFGALASREVNIILITQASSVHTMCVAVEESDAQRSKEAIDEVFAYEISLGKVEPLKVETGFSILSLVGDDMKNQSGTSGRMFDALGRAGINIRAIAQGSSEKNVSTVLARKDVEAATKAIHEEFFALKRKRVNLFISGYGNVGKEFIKIVESQKEFIAKKYNTNIEIVAVCNSKRILINPDGLEAITPQRLNTEGREIKGEYIPELIEELPNKNTIFIDCTGSEEIASIYTDILSLGVSIITCNKIANSQSLDSYQRIRRAAANSGSHLFYETNVGAALPVISTINQMVNSGDQIEKTEAILSGTLNYLFSNYNGTKSFAILVKEAVEAGYAEPDPRLDLSGGDVLRKVLILAREMGYPTQKGDIELSPILPQEIMDGSIDNFYTNLEQYEPHFKELYKNCLNEAKVLRYTATITKDRLEASLKAIPKDNPLSSVNGTDNCFIITSKHYPSPIVIKGAGAGGIQTASGVFNDLLKLI